MYSTSKSCKKLVQPSWIYAELQQNVNWTLFNVYKTATEKYGTQKWKVAQLTNKTNCKEQACLLLMICIIFNSFTFFSLFMGRSIASKNIPVEAATG